VPQPRLTPVSGDPFAAAPTTGAKLTPVDGDPFAKPKEEPGFFSRVVDAVTGKTSAEAAKRYATTPTGAADIARIKREREDASRDARAATFRKQLEIRDAHGVVSRGRALLAKGAASFDAGLSRLTGQDERAGRMEAIVRTALPNETTFEDVKTLAPSSIGNFVLEQGVQSLPAMGAMIASLPAFVASQTGNIAQARAVNDGRTEQTWTDRAIALPVAGASAALDRFGFGKIIAPGAGSVVLRPFKSGAIEAGTEGVQGLGEYAGGSVGTEKGFDLSQAIDTTLGGTLAGFGVGAAGRTAIEAPQALASAVRGPQALAEAARLEAPLQTPSQPIEPVSQPVARPAPRLVPVQGDPFAPTPAAGAPALPGAVDPQPVANPNPAAAGGDGLGQVEPPAEFKPTHRTSDDGRALAAAQGVPPERVDAWTAEYVAGRERKFRVNTDPELKAAWELGEKHRADLDGPAPAATAATPEPPASPAQATPAQPEGTPGPGRPASDEAGRRYKGDRSFYRKHDAFVGGAAVARGERTEPFHKLTNKGEIEAFEEGKAWQLEQAKPPPEPAAQTTPAEPAPLRPEPGELAEGERTVRTPAGGSIRTRFEVVDASELTQAEGANQNRDRSRDTTSLQVQDIISNFDPELLHEDASSDRGAPIVGPDGAIDSGNGRMLTLNKIYDDHPELAAKYRAMIESRGLSTEGKERPILIQRRMTDFTPEQRRQFVIDSNKDTKLAMTPVETARSDADSITPEMLAKYAGGDLNSAGNAGFVQEFAKRLTTGEMGNFIGTDRRLTTAGLDRIENAVVAAAYGNPKLLERMMESTQDDIKAITSSLADVAPAWAMLRAKTKAGDIEAQYDITADLADAAARVSDARKRGTPPADILAQQDAFDQISPVAAELVRAFYNSAMSRPASKKAVTEFLRDYVAAASKAEKTEGLFGEEPAPSPVSILKTLLNERDNPNGATMFDAPAKEKDNGRGETRNRTDADPTDRQAGPLDRPDATPEPRRANDADAAPRRDEGRGEDPARERPDAARSGLDARRKAASAAQDALEDEAEAPQYGLANPAPGRAQGLYAESFEDASFTDRTSIFNSAAETLGMDPEKFTLLPAPRQVALLQRAMFQRFGIKVDVDKGMQERFAIDQMLDAYQNVQGMAHVLDLPSQAMSLGGKLSLRLQKKAGFLGQFESGRNIVTLPRRSNSFSHEWGHALDWYLLEAVGAGGRGLSGAIRKRGAGVDTDALPENVPEAFVSLLNTMFFDKAEVAARILELETKIAQTNSAKVKAASQLAIDKLAGGNSQVRDLRSAFYKGAKAFDGPGGDYWTSPTEMLARSFEAYTSYKVEAAGLTTEFIGKGDAGYLEGAGSRFELTFPKGEERALIFAAYEHLFGLIADAQMIAPGPGADKPGGTVRRMTDYDKTPKVAKERGIIQRELTAIKASIRQTAKEKAGRGDDPKGTLEKLADLNGTVFMSMTGNLRMIQGRSGSHALQTLIDLLTKQDGKGDRTVRRTFHEDVHLQSKAAVNRLGNILKANGAESLGVEDTKLLRDLLTETKEGTVVVPPGMDHIVKAAAGIRHLLDNEFYVNQKAGIDLGYTRNGYLARVLDLPRVWNNQKGFVTAATEVYEIVFDNEYGTPAALLGNEVQLPIFMRLAGFLAKKKGYPIPSLQPVRALLKTLGKAIAAQEAAEARGADTTAIDAQIAKISAELDKLFPELHAEVKAAYANERAEAWLGNINLVAGEEHNAPSPDSKYTKHRELPPEADKIMEKFYLADPVESVTNYLVTSARRTAYARRFGADGKRRVALFERMSKEGVTPDDQRQVERILDTATGRVRSALPKSVQDGAAFVNAAGTMALLPRAMISSLAEPFTTGLVTGDARDGFKMLGMIIGGALGSPSGKTRFELARAMGLVSDAGSDGIMEARYGQTFADTTRWDRYTSTMFQRTGLTGLTRAQVTANVGMGHAFLDNLALQITGKPGKARTGAIALYRELGISDPDAFATELLRVGRMPALEDLDTPYGEDYRTAQLRYSRMTVQQPDAMDRPELAQNPVGRVIYGITGFSYSYWRNIMKRNAILLREIAKRDGAAVVIRSAGLMASAAVAYLLGTTISTIREKLLNPKRWAELERKGTLHTQMAQLGFTRTFSFGAADTFIQTWSGLKYQRDLSNVFVGPGPGFFLQNAQKMAQPISKNSRKTNTAEYNALQGAYSTASPFIAFGLARIPGGPIVDVTTGVGMAYVTSASARDEFAGAIVGPKNLSPGPDGEKVKSGPTAFDKLMNESFGEVKRKERAD
jgi:hypothetical protein